MKLSRINLITTFAIVCIAIVNLFFISNSSSTKSNLKSIIKVAMAQNEDTPCPDCIWEDLDVETRPYTSYCSFVCWTSSGIYAGSGSCQVSGTQYIASCYGEGIQYCINGVMMTSSSSSNCPTSSNCSVQCD